MIDGTKLIAFFNGLWPEDQEADEIKKGISTDLKEYAESIEVSPKAIRSAWTLFKKYKGGKNSQQDVDDYSEISGVIENYFASGMDDAI